MGSTNALNFGSDGFAFLAHDTMSSAGPDNAGPYAQEGLDGAALLFEQRYTMRVLLWRGTHGVEPVINGGVTIYNAVRVTSFVTLITLFWPSRHKIRSGFVDLISSFLPTTVFPY